MRKHDGKKPWEKSNSSTGSGSGSDLKIEAMQQMQQANFDPLDNVNMSKQQSNNTQYAVTHSRLLSKKTHLSDTILPVISLFSLRSNNLITQTLQLKTQQSNRKHSGASENSLTIQDRLELLVFYELWLLKLINLGLDGQIVIF